jgi:HD-like signal output (HDOD) protein
MNLADSPDYGPQSAIADLLEQVNQSEIRSIKSVITRLLDIMNDARSTAKDLTDIIQVDPPLTAKVLKLANSAYFSPRERISEIKKAIIYIGFNNLKEILLNQKVVEIFRTEDTVEGYSRSQLWRHSVAVALMGKMIYRREFGLPGENVYAAGLMHDIGIIAIDQFLQEPFRETLKLSKAKKIPLTHAEREIIGFTHADVGLAIGTNWNLASDITVPIGYHHSPLLAEESYLRLSSTLFVSEYYCHTHKFGFGARETVPAARPTYLSILKQLDITPSAIDMIFQDMAAEIAIMQRKGLL